MWVTDLCRAVWRRTILSESTHKEVGVGGRLKVGALGLRAKCVVAATPDAVAMDVSLGEVEVATQLGG